MSYNGTHPAGRRFYVTSKKGAPLAFAVFARDIRQPEPKWQRVSVIEDRPYLDELHRVNGCYEKFEGAMPAIKKAEEIAEWYRHVLHGWEAVVVPLRPSKERS